MNKINILLALFLFYGCITVTNKNPDEYEFKEMKVKSQYSINLPDYLTHSETILNEESSLEYSNKKKQFYVMVIDENKSDLTKDGEPYTLKDYFENSTSNLAGGLMEVKTTPPEAIKINGLNGYKISIGGKNNKTPLVYKCEILESSKHFYQVYCWTIIDLLPKNEKDMNTILDSFKEL